MSFRNGLFCRDLPATTRMTEYGTILACYHLILGVRTQGARTAQDPECAEWTPLPLHPTPSPPPLAPLTEGVGCKGRGVHDRLPQACAIEGGQGGHFPHCTTYRRHSNNTNFVGVCMGGAMRKVDLRFSNRTRLGQPESGAKCCLDNS